MFSRNQTMLTELLPITLAFGLVASLAQAQGFADPGFWATYDYGADPSGCPQNPNCVDPDGYTGAVFDGRYVYFVPRLNGTEYHGEVLRFDTGRVVVPAVSAWGLIVVAGLLCSVGVYVFGKLRPARTVQP